MNNGYKASAADSYDVTTVDLERIARRLAVSSPLRFWVSEMLNTAKTSGFNAKQLYTIKVRGRPIKVSESTKRIFDVLIKSDKEMAWRVAKSYKLAWGTHHFMRDLIEFTGPGKNDEEIKLKMTILSTIQQLIFKIINQDAEDFLKRRNVQ